MSNDHQGDVHSKADYVDALKSVKLEELKDIGKIPCARTSLLYGIGAGFGIAALRFITKRNIKSSSNWAVGTFCGVSAINFELCQMERKQKLERLQLIVKESDSKARASAIRKGIQVVIDEPAASSKD
ncbi:hypothetical protein DM01DRAFT_1387022 [Hesseltinella vesiculosa]|uniref:Cytochrome c oxidase assembly protein COX20, mitochondrial n=1 Tax=Hesseltinella vesiculosa TaxID=101127 RepID=A0A1X2G3H9_9FUNG|nr:hypothetical protein DM01DRAFT_1387022 [Hesseltinella vesiculosa]